MGTSGPHRGNPASKKARVSSSEEDDEIAQRRNFELLSTAEEGTLSSATYSNLVRDTFQLRRKFITQEVNSSKEILNVCPYLGKPSHVQSELSRIIGAENVTGAEDHLEKALKVLHGGENLTNIEVVEAIKMIQQRTKSKGSNQDVFKFQDPMTCTSG